MLIILCLLVVAGVILAVVSIIFPISTDMDSNTNKSFAEAESGMATTQLKSQIFSLETEVKQMCVNYTAIRTDFDKLRNKESRLIDHLLNQKNLHDAQNEIYQLTSNNLILQDKVNRLLHFEEENKDFLLKNSKLSSEIERLQSESQNRDNEIILLRQKCDYMQTNLNDVNGRIDEIIRGYGQEKRRSEELRDNLFKQKVVYSDIEKELRRLREENEELKDGLAYEINN